MTPSQFLWFCVFVTLLYKVMGQETKATKYFQDKANIKIKPYSLQAARNAQLLTSNLEIYRDLFSHSRQFSAHQYYRDFKNNNYNRNNGKMQQKVGLDVPFPCGLNNTRSSETPTSVHRLRPGDIDIIAAMGDSLTAGTGMMSKSFLQLLVEFRGATMLGGGLRNWRSYLTLPNILKVFNPHLYGYAVANTLGKFREARFNVAEPAAMTQDMPYMAEILVKRMQNDPYVNMRKHWKMVSMFIGTNDVCSDMCHLQIFSIADFLETHRQNLGRTLRILRDKIPRLMVNVVLIPNIATSIAVMKGIPATCQSFHKVACSCIVSSRINSTGLEDKSKILERFYQAAIEVASLPEFQLEEFAVVPRTMAVNKTLPLNKNGNTDLKYFATDCFHYSQYGNAAFANMLWNDMLQSRIKISKTDILRPFEIFNCPTEEQSYLSTLGIS